MTGPEPAELREKAQHLLRRFGEIRQAGSGAITMEELFQVVGAPSDGRVAEQLAARGPLEIHIAPDGLGQFRNEGPAVEAELGPVKLYMPSLVCGTVQAVDGAVFLEFDREQTVVGTLMAMRLGVRRIEITEHFVAVRLPNRLLDLKYTF